MRIVIIYIWLITTILPTFSKWGTLAYYQINKEFITKVLCQNRNKPQLNCDGRCYLAKMLRKQQEKEDQKTSEQVQNLPILQLFASAMMSFSFLNAISFPNRQSAFSYLMGSYQAPLSITVPPPCL